MHTGGQAGQFFRCQAALVQAAHLVLNRFSVEGLILVRPLAIRRPCRPSQAQQHTQDACDDSPYIHTHYDYVATPPDDP